MADPTVTDVFNQLVLVNGKLDQIELNTSLVTVLNASINSGFTATVNGLKAIALINIESVKLQYHQTQQNDTIICYLEQISKQTCEMLNLIAIQTKFQQQMKDDLSALRYIGESAHAGAVLEKHRHDELKRQMEECCPPRPDKAPCNFQPCERPKPIRPPRVPQIDIPGDGKENDNPNHG
jgi:hypothetical protein